MTTHVKPQSELRFSLSALMAARAGQPVEEAKRYSLAEAMRQSTASTKGSRKP